MYKQSDPFYRSAAWRRVRCQALKRDGGMCVYCMARFLRGEIRKPRWAAMVHHIKPRELYPELSLALDNLASSCDICHNREHPEKGGRGKAGEKPALPLPEGEAIEKIR